MCSPDDKAARIQAAIDALYGRDNSAAVEDAFDLQAQLNYVGRHADLRSEMTPRLASPKTNGIREHLFGDLADLSHHPNEVLGDDIVTPVLEAYERYAKSVAGENAGRMSQITFDKEEAKLNRDKVSEMKEDAGLTDAIAEAQDMIEERFADDPDRLEYGKEWLNLEVKGMRGKPNIIDKTLNYLGGNLSKNLLLNNIRTGFMNHFQTWTTTLPEFGFRDTSKGLELYRKAVKRKDPEIDFIGGGKFYDTESKLDKIDFFSMPEHYNQGLTYFSAKAKALREGKIESQARAEGRKAIEKTQFLSRLGNRPRAYWKSSGQNHLRLMSFGIQMRKLHHGWVKEAFNGTGETARNARRALVYYYGFNALINGVTADIPDEPAAILKYFAPKAYNALRKLDRVSIAGLLDMDTAEISRNPITPAGYVLKVPAIYSKLADASDAVQNALNHPNSVKTWIKAVQQTSLFAPPVPIVGNKNTGNLLEWFYRAQTGDYNRSTFKGRKYQTDFPTETMRVIKGRGLTESQKAAERDAG